MANFEIIVILLIGISFGISEIVAKDETKAIHDEVFASKSLFSALRKRSSLDKTYALLIRLSSLYKNGKQDSESERHRAEVDSLIETRKVGPEKCNFLEIYKQTIIHSGATLNIIPYLTDNIERLFNFCKATLYNQLNRGLSNFNDQEKDDMEKIRLYIIHGRHEVREPLYYISPEAIEDGLIDFLRDRIRDGKTNELVDFDTVVGGLCGKVVYELNEPLGTLGLVYDGGRRPLLNEEAVSWLTNMEICKSIIESAPELGRHVETKLLKIYTKG